MLIDPEELLQANEDAIRKTLGSECAEWFRMAVEESQDTSKGVWVMRLRLVLMWAATIIERNG